MLEIRKETCEKCGIKTIGYQDKENGIIELWQKMCNVEKQTNHTNIADATLKRIRKYCAKKTKEITKKEYYIKYILKVKQIYFIIEKLARDIIEPSKIPDAINFKKNWDIIRTT